MISEPKNATQRRDVDPAFAKARLEELDKKEERIKRQIFLLDVLVFLLGIALLLGVVHLIRHIWITL
ncbi:hypothetical protein [Nonlabens xiamenensis]|uniref:hypothetical protein n=1 Tax=Nonlabens xiamenensis TaxID=2341043 RepID=UPI000F60B947|nr:hypothetical protein [Nonlabens xiamenensis]